MAVRARREEAAGQAEVVARQVERRGDGEEDQEEQADRLGGKAAT